MFGGLAAACAGGGAQPPAEAPPVSAAGPRGPLLLPIVASEPASAAHGDGKPDLAVVHSIKDEAYRRGRVMDHLFAITDVNGPRLTASPGFRKAADWAVRTLASWGAANAHLEPWGRFGRAWSVDRFEISLVEPAYARLSGVPKAWSRGTNGPVTGPVALAPLFPDREDRDDGYDFAKLTARIRAYAQTYKGKLHGRFA